MIAQFLIARKKFASLQPCGCLVTINLPWIEFLIAEPFRIACLLLG